MDDVHGRAVPGSLCDSGLVANFCTSHTVGRRKGFLAHRWQDMTLAAWLRRRAGGLRS